MEDKPEMDGVSGETARFSAWTVTLCFLAVGVGVVVFWLIKGSEVIK